MNPHKAEML